MMNPIFIEHQVQSHQAALLHEAETERLMHDTAAGTDTRTLGVRAWLGDLLLGYGLRLKGVDVGRGATALATRRFALEPAAPAIGLPAGVRLDAPARARPAFGFSLLRYEALPAVGVMFWRLDTLGARGAYGNGYLTLTWLAGDAH
ncbi:MAG: hypothetical protein ACHQ4H_04690 [Ktedonobacterales bacterium]